MKSQNRLTAAIFAAALMCTSPAAAQTRDGVMGELMKDTADVEKKVLALANAMPEAAYELEKSFAFLRASMSGTTDVQLNTPVDMFGQKSTARGVWITTATHLHEHLGQLIAYARSNKIVPPWSK